jgi:predicted RNA-binding Zn-ribbon protein involved in translation (DUF1610 family)
VEEGKQEKKSIKCNNCGYSTEPYALMRPAIFPKNYRLYSSYVTSAGEKFSCPQCEKEIPNTYASLSAAFSTTTRYQ